MPIENNQATIKQKINSKFKKTSSLLKEKFFTKKAVKSNIFKILKSHYFWVFIFGLVLNAFIFRDVLLAYPQIINGDALIGPEELVPITDFQTQYIDQQLNPYSVLTDNYEFRVRYSLLTTWTRYYLALPALGLIGLNALSLTIIYTAIYKLLNYFLKETRILKEFIILSSLVGAMLSYFILLYSKITHFYTLIFGFSLFTLAVSFLIILLFNFNNQTKKQRNFSVIAVILLTIFNPATHYVILTIFIGGILLFFSLIFNVVNIIKHKNIWKEELMKSGYILLTVVSSAAFYLIYYFVYITTFNKFNVSEYVFITNNLIKYASSDLLQITSLQTGSILDFYYYGNYQINPPSSRMYNILYSLTLPLIFFYGLFKYKANKKFLGLTSLILIVSGIAIFFAFGFESPYSAHNLTAKILPILNDSPSFINTTLIQLISTFFLVLRFPHRFLFIYELMVSISFAIFTALFLQSIDRFFAFSKTVFKHTILVLIGIILMVPFLYGADISKTLFSGNYNGFFNSYTIPQDLKDIKNYLANNKGGKLVVLPTTEAPYRTTEDTKGNRIRVIDKFFLYYLNYSGQYYGLSADINYKNNYFLLYLSAEERINWFNFLRNKDVEYVLVNKTQKIKDGFNNLNDIEQNLKDGANKMVEEGLATKVVSGDYFDLIKINKQYVDKKTTLFLNDDWQKTKDSLTRSMVNYSDNSVYNISKQACNEQRFNVLGSVEKTIQDLNVLCNKSILQYNSQLTPFSKTVQSSNDFISNIFSMMATSQSPKFNPYNTLSSINPGTYNTLRPEILFIDKQDDTLTYNFSVKNKANYSIDVRARSVNSKIEFIIFDADNNIKYQIKQNLIDEANFINSDGDVVLNNFKYYNLAKNLDLEKGNYLVKFTKLNDQAIGVDALTYYTDQQILDIRNSYQITKKDIDLYEFIKK